MELFSKEYVKTKDHNELISKDNLTHWLQKMPTGVIRFTLSFPKWRFKASKFHMFPYCLWDTEQVLLTSVPESMS